MSSDLTQVLQVGTTLAIASGEYSDFGYEGVVCVIRPFTKKEVADRYVSEWVATDDSYRDQANPEDFLPWLVREGYVEAIDNFTQWHVGSYGDFRP